VVVVIVVDVSVFFVCVLGLLFGCLPFSLV
jgi:hypothetical protein